MNEMRRLMNLCESDDISQRDLVGIRKHTGTFKSPGKFIRFHAEKALRILGMPEEHFMQGLNTYVGSWVDTGKTASRIKYGGLSNYVSDSDIERLKAVFQDTLPDYRTDVYRVSNRDQRFRGRNDGLAFKIYFY